MLNVSIGKSQWWTYGVGLLCLVLVGLNPLTGAADEQPLLKAESSDQERIHVTSDSLTTDSTENVAIFDGNVQATQGDAVITCDQLKVFYGDNPLGEGEAGTNQGSVKVVEAIGNVRIRAEDRLAFADKAVYTLATGKIVLTGNNAKVTSGNNSVMGEKITMFRDDNNMIVERGDNKQVEAILYSGDTDKE